MADTDKVISYPPVRRKPKKRRGYRWRVAHPKISLFGNAEWYKKFDMIDWNK